MTVETQCGQSSTASALTNRFPALARVPRAPLTTLPTPVERHRGPGGVELWVKRDDLSALVAGGNKVRALEYLLGTVGPGDTVVTLGGQGSTHVLATATHAALLGARTIAFTWPHEMNASARETERSCQERCWRVLPSPFAVTALARYALPRGRGYHCVPLGGTSPLGMLGHVNAGLELASQIAAGVLPAPARIVVPLGSGGTAAGLALGLGLGGYDGVVVAARVVPRLAASAWRLRRLIRATRGLLQRLSGTPRESMPAAPIEIDHSVYGGAYGRPLDPPPRLDGLDVDDTYSAKALASALRRSTERGPTLFWLTYDRRAARAGAP